eukprot:scaffold108_cov162-Amphora_coffeaeformis.AAC.15
MMSFRVLCCVLVVALAQLVVETTAYASWLPCYVEFADDEVVMNHPIVAAENAKTTLQLQLRPQGKEDWTHAFENEFEVTAGQVYEVQFDLATVRGQLDFMDLQFVLETSAGGSFGPDRSAHCENLRAHGDGEGIRKFAVDGTVETVNLVGAWALGHSEVTLTPAAKLRVVQGTAAQDL